MRSQAARDAIKGRGWPRRRTRMAGSVTATATWWPHSDEPLLVIMIPGPRRRWRGHGWALRDQGLDEFACWGGDYLNPPVTSLVSARREAGRLMVSRGGRSWVSCPLPDDETWASTEQCFVGVCEAPQRTDVDVAALFISRLDRGALIAVMTVAAEIPASGALPVVA